MPIHIHNRRAGKRDETQHHRRVIIGTEREPHAQHNRRAKHPHTSSTEEIIEIIIIHILLFSSSLFIFFCIQGPTEPDTAGIITGENNKEQ